jgi:hypothetical protein
MSRCEKLLWISAAASCAGVAAAAVTRATAREWVVAVIAAAVTTQGAIYASCVARRIDRMYTAALADAMKTGATTLPTRGAPPGERRLRLAPTGTGPHRML